MMAAAFEQVHEPVEVRLHVSLRIGERITYAGLCAEIEHGLEAVAFEELLQRLFVGQINFSEGEARRFLQLREPIALQRHVVIGAHIIEADDCAALRQQTLRQVKADEARGAGDENGCHRVRSIGGERPKSNSGAPNGAGERRGDK